MRSHALALIAWSFAAVGSAANVYWIPATAHAVGVGGSLWRTDVAVLNLDAVPGSVELRLHRSAGVSSRAFEIGAGRQQVFEDVLAALVDGDSSGSLEIVSDRILSVRSRTYNETSTGTFGQGLDGITSVSGLAAGGSAALIAIEENASFRTNLGILNMGDVEAGVNVTLFASDGSVVGNYVLQIPPGELRQDSRPFANRFGRTDVRGGSAEISVTSGAGVYAYASVIDNRTGDPTTIAMGSAFDCD